MCANTASTRAAKAVPPSVTKLHLMSNPRSHLPTSHPSPDKIIFVTVSSLSIISLNVSLMVNHVGFYQIAKLMVVPFVCLIEFFWLGKRYSYGMVGAILVVVMGVAIVTVESVEGGSMLGVCIAGLSIFGSGMQQILCNEMQERLGIRSSQMLLATAWPQVGRGVACGERELHKIICAWPIRSMTS